MAHGQAGTCPARGLSRPAPRQAGIRPGVPAGSRRHACSTSAATTAPAWRTCPAGSASPSPRSTTTWTARKTCWRWRSTGRWTACSASPTRSGQRRARHRPAGTAGARQRQRARRPAALRHPAAARPRQHRHRARALARRREFDEIVADLVKEAEQDGDIRPDVDPAITARLLFGLVNSLVEWYRPGPARDVDGRARRRGLRGRVRRPAHPPRGTSRRARARTEIR